MNSNQKLDASLRKLENSFAKSDRSLKEYINVKRHRNSILIKELEEVVSQISYELLERKKKMQPLFPSNIRQHQAQNNMSQRQVNQKKASQKAAPQKAGATKETSAPQKVAPQKAARARQVVSEDFKNTIVQAPKLDYYDLEWQIPHTQHWVNREREFLTNPNQMYIYNFYSKRITIEYYDHYDYHVSDILQKLLREDYLNMEMIRSTMDWLFPVYNNTNNFKTRLNIDFNINQFPQLSPGEDEKLYMDYDCMYRYFFAFQLYLLNFGFRIYEDKFFKAINVKLKSDDNDFDLANYNYFIYMKESKESKSNYHVNKVIIYLFARIAISLKLMQLDYLIPTWRESIKKIKTKITEMGFQNDEKYRKIINAIDLLVDILYRITITVMGPAARQKPPFSFKISDSNNDFFVVEKIK